MQKGGDTLWEELYEAHYRELTAYGARMCGSRELAETAHSYLVSALAPDSRRVAAPASEDINLMREAD